MMFAALSVLLATTFGVGGAGGDALRLLVGGGSGDGGGGKEGGEGSGTNGQSP